MSERNDDPAAKGDWTGKPGGDAQVKVAPPTLAPTPPLDTAAATLATPEPDAAPMPAKSPVIAPNSGYAVFFFPAALDALGGIVKPYVEAGSGEPHILCREVDTGGAFIELTLDVVAEGQSQQVALMVPSNMVRLIMSVRSDDAFGFTRPRGKVEY